MCDNSSAPAYVLWVELSTRIATQPLHYRSGEEETAVESIVKTFQKTRDLMEKNPHAKNFEVLALALLNDTLRPYTARWHGWMTEDKELRDGNGKPVLKFRDQWVRRQFRRELRDLQPKLWGFMKACGAMKEGKSAEAWWTSPGPKELETLRKECPHYDNANLGMTIIPGIREQVVFAGVKMEKLPVFVACINKKEQNEIRKRRGIENGTKLVNLSALAFSGGGIRSATFCLGITQVLARKGLFQHFDYMSTVSGGGYLGSFLSAYLGTGDKVSPEGSHPDEATEANARLDKVFKTGENQREPSPVRHLRNWSRYLLDGGFGRKFTGIGMVVAGVLFNLLIILPVPIIAALLTKLMYEMQWLGDFNWTAPDGTWIPPLNSYWSIVMFVVLVVTACAVLLYPAIKIVSLKASRDTGTSKALAVWKYTFLLLSGLSVGLLACWFLPLEFRIYEHIRNLQLLRHFNFAKDHFEAMGTVLGTLLTAVLGASATKHNPGGLISRILGKSVILVGPLLYLFCYFGVGYRMMFAHESVWPWQLVLCVVIGLLIWAWLLVDVNTYSPHGYYRDRLSECYLQQPKLTEAKDGQPQKLDLASSDRLLLTQLNKYNAAPYHLINATLNIPSSKNREVRGRNGDFFLFSKHFCGSPLAGYYPTKRLEDADPHFDLGTAMAISGAAVSSNMGWQTNNSMRLLMTLANVRLGYWLRNPSGKKKTWKFLGPGPLCLLREMFASGMDENGRHLNLSDGGHIENLAAYELLRRRCKFIVCVDGGMEPGMECADLMRLERYAAIDLGIRMHYDITDLKLQTSGSSLAYGVLVKIDYSPPKDESTRLARQPKDAEWGWMLYLKLAMVGYGPGYVLDYKRQNPTFPHQTTAEQLYTEGQFEAYRALGEAAAESFFTSEIIDGQDPANVEAWFQCLANCLLPDNDEAFR